MTIPDELVINGQFYRRVDTNAHTVSEIILNACCAAGITVAEANSAIRRKNLADARAHVYHTLYHEHGWTASLIGKRLSRDASSVHHAIKKHERLLASAE